jgi:hypothetical protein
MHILNRYLIPTWVILPTILYKLRSSRNKRERERGERERERERETEREGERERGK